MRTFGWIILMRRVASTPVQTACARPSARAQAPTEPPARWRPARRAPARPRRAPDAVRSVRHPVPKERVVVGHQDPHQATSSAATSGTRSSRRGTTLPPGWPSSIGATHGHGALSHGLQAEGRPIRPRCLHRLADRDRRPATVTTRSSPPRSTLTIARRAAAVLADIRGMLATIRKIWASLAGARRNPSRGIVRRDRRDEPPEQAAEKRTP